MNRTEVGANAIAQSFATISGVRSFTCFSRITPEQRACVVELNACCDEIFACKARDLHLKTLVNCITGYDDFDEDEPVSEGHFSQHRFYKTFVNELIYFPDRFDFLIHCILHQVCLVRHTAKFRELLRALLHKQSERTVPTAVLDYDKLIEADDEMRIESFTMKKDWRSLAPSFAEVTRDAIAAHDSQVM
jgi:hypothetical protein